METQDKWMIVIFNEDHSVEVVPDSWLNNSLCAWPKSKVTKKIIEKRLKPNNIDFNFFKARQLGKKTFGRDTILKFLVFNCNSLYFILFLDSLAEAKLKLTKATFKSELSSTEDECTKKQKRKFKCRKILSPSDDLKKTKLGGLKPKFVKDSPPRYKNKSNVNLILKLSLIIYIIII